MGKVLVMLKKKLKVNLKYIEQLGKNCFSVDPRNFYW